MTIISPFRRASFLARTNFGRASGWILELDGSPVGQLFDCVTTDMFWDSYSVAPLHGVNNSRLWDDELWNACKFRFKNRESGEYVDEAFCGGSPPFVRDGRILLRRLYLTPKTGAETILVTMLGKLTRVARKYH